VAVGVVAAAVGVGVGVSVGVAAFVPGSEVEHCNRRGRRHGNGLGDDVGGKQSQRQ